MHGDAQCAEQAFLFAKLCVQQTEVIFHEAVSLEALAPVVLAVVDVDGARQSVYIAAHRIHRRRQKLSATVSLFGSNVSSQPTNLREQASIHAVIHGRTRFPCSSRTNRSSL